MPGTYTISVTGTGQTNTHTVTFPLVVNTPPTITSPNTATFTVGIPGTFTVSATGSTPIGLSGRHLNPSRWGDLHRQR